MYNMNKDTEKLTTKIDSISFIGYASTTLHTTIDTYCKLNAITKHAINTKNSMSKYLYKSNKTTIFNYKTLVNKDGLVLNIIEFNGLITLNAEVDTLREEKLFNILEYLNVRTDIGKLEIRALDICADMNISNDKVIVQKEKVRGNRLDRLIVDIGTKTQYIETVKKKKTLDGLVLDRSNMLTSSYLYNKTFKEHSTHGRVITDDITRFELKVLARMWKRIHCIEDLRNVANKYVIETYSSKNMCNKDKRLLNAKKAYSGGAKHVLDMQGVEDYLLRMEKYVTLDLETKKDTVAFDLNDFM